MTCRHDQCCRLRKNINLRNVLMSQDVVYTALLFAVPSVLTPGQLFAAAEPLCVW